MGTFQNGRGSLLNLFKKGEKVKKCVQKKRIIGDAKKASAAIRQEDGLGMTVREILRESYAFWGSLLFFGNKNLDAYD